MEVPCCTRSRDSPATQGCWVTALLLGTATPALAQPLPASCDCGEPDVEPAAEPFAAPLPTWGFAAAPVARRAGLRARAGRLCARRFRGAAATRRCLRQHVPLAARASVLARQGVQVLRLPLRPTWPAALQVLGVYVDLRTTSRPAHRQDQVAGRPGAAARARPRWRFIERACHLLAPNRSLGVQLVGDAEEGPDDLRRGRVQRRVRRRQPRPERRRQLRWSDAVFAIARDGQSVPADSS